MKKANTIGGLVFAAMSATASAAITGPVTIDFNGFPAAVFGRSNVAPTGTGDCPLYLGYGCYTENAVIFGTLDDPTPFSGAGAHIHGINYDPANPANTGLEYHSDSAGVYIRLKDGSAFSLNKLDFHAPISAENPDSGPNDSWLVLGFSTATNPTLTTDTAFPTLVASYTVPNGTDGTLALPSSFHNVKSVWIHYNGYPRVPVDPDLVLDPVTGQVISDGPLQAKEFKTVIDNIALSAPMDAAAQTECLFNWAEKNYANLFSPAGQATAHWSVYTYRYYPATNAYVGVSSADNHVYYLGPDGNMADVGALSYWLPFVGCQ